MMARAEEEVEPEAVQREAVEEVRKEVDKRARDLISSEKEYEEEWKEDSKVASYKELLSLAKENVRLRMLINNLRMQIDNLGEIVRSEHPQRSELQNLQRVVASLQQQLQSE